MLATLESRVHQLQEGKDAIIDTSSASFPKLAHLEIPDLHHCYAYLRYACRYTIMGTEHSFLERCRDTNFCLAGVTL